MVSSVSLDAFKSANDKRLYRLVTLPNSMQALLIESVSNSSEISMKAAACLTVGIGSFADPPQFQGLAHYLEHMLFMGKYKSP